MATSVSVAATAAGVLGAVEPLAVSLDEALCLRNQCGHQSQSNPQPHPCHEYVENRNGTANVLSQPTGDEIAESHGGEGGDREVDALLVVPSLNGIEDGSWDDQEEDSCGEGETEKAGKASYGGSPSLFDRTKGSLCPSLYD